MDDESFTLSNARKPSYEDTIIPTVALVVLIGGAVLLFELDALHGPVQLALMFSTMVVALIPRAHENHGKGDAAIGMTAIGLNIEPADQ